ncbi:MAG: hypothetical protein AB1757_07985 [Acidobacteriota bacterium]
MDVTISIPTELEVVLKERAAQFGKDADDYLSQLVTKHLERPALDEILAPVRKDFAKSGMTEEELNQLIEEERQALWDEKSLHI